MSDDDIQSAASGKGHAAKAMRQRANLQAKKPQTRLGTMGRPQPGDDGPTYLLGKTDPNTGKTDWQPFPTKVISRDQF